MARQSSKKDKAAKRAKRHRKKAANRPPVTQQTLERMSRRERIKRLEFLVDNQENRIEFLEWALRRMFDGPPLEDEIDWLKFSQEFTPTRKSL